MADDRDLRIRILLQALDKVTKPLREIGRGSSATAKKLKETRDRLREIEKTQADVAGFRKLKEGLRSTDAALDTAKQRVAALAREISATDSPTKKLTAEFAKAKREAAALKDQHEREAVTLQRLRDKLSAAGVATSSLAIHERQLRAEAGRANSEIEDQSRRLEEMQRRTKRLATAKESFGKAQEMASRALGAGTAGIAAGVEIEAPIADMVKDAMQLEDALAGVRKVSQMAQPEIRKMADDFQDMSSRIPITADELAEMAESAAAAGVGHGAKDQRQQLEAFTEQAAKMGVAFRMSAEDAGTTMMAWREAFQLPLPKLRDLGDQVNKLTTVFGGKGDEIAEVLGRIGPLGKVAGVAAPQIAAMASSLDSLHIAPEVAATGLKDLMLQLNMGESARKRLMMGYKALGLDAVAVAKSMQINSAGTILDVLERVARLPKATQASVLTNLVGREAVAAVAPLLTNLDGLKKRFDLVGDASQYAGSMQREFETRTSTTSNEVKLAENNFQNLKITVGTLLLPTIIHLAQRLGAALKSLRSFTAAHPQLVGAAVKVAAVIGGVTAGFGALLIMVAGLLAPFAALTFVAGALDMALAPVIAIAATIVAGLAVLGFAVYEIYKHWSAITGFFAGVWERVKQIFSAALGVLKAYLAPFATFGSNIVEGIIDGITNRLAALKSAVVGAASAAADWFKEKLGIHSPSRVFHQFGGFMMQGLGNGIDQGAGGPLRRVSLLSRDLTAALAVGAATPAIAANGPAAARGAQRSAPPAGSMRASPIEIHIHAAPGMDERMLAELVERKLLEMERRRQVAARSSYRDDPDHGGLV